MKLFSMGNRNYILLGFILLFFGCKNASEKNQSSPETLPYYSEASFTPHWLNSSEVEEFHRIPSYSLTNQDGETVTEKTFEDKIYVADFFFTTCPGICPKMTANMSVLQEAFKDDNDILLLSHSVTPEQDSVAVLKAYAKDKEVISGKWHLVTGARKTIYDLGRNQYFAEENLGEEKSEDDFLHTENFVLIDKNRHIRGIYNGLNTAAIEQLIADIKILKKED